AVGEPDDEHSRRPACLEREPHQGDVLKCVSELARGDGCVREPEVASAEEAESAPRRLAFSVREPLLPFSRQYIGQNCLQAVNQSSAREASRRPSRISTPGRCLYGSTRCDPISATSISHGCPGS